FAYGLTAAQYGYDFDQPFDGVVAYPHAEGEHIRLEGVVLDGDGQPMPDAMIEISQLDAQGRPAERFDSPRAEGRRRGFRGFGRVGTGTDPEQRFDFQTVKPGVSAPGEAPHIDLIVMMRGLLVHAFTRVYFSDEAGANASDPVLRQVPAGRRDTLVAQRSEQGGQVIYRFDIHMQGPRETVFFDV
ncbi:MAG: pcaG, partial [Variovorax sp.]|nr:pcaG [Variovorax sp.]